MSDSGTCGDGVMSDSGACGDGVMIFLIIERPQQSVSWCRMECVIGGIENVKLAPLQAPPPPLVTMSLSFTLTLNTKTHTNEVSE